jgi:hypothetical protein
MTNYIFHQAVCPIAAVAAEFFPPDHRVRHVCLEGKNERRTGVWEKRDPR